jgi:hypothetical protein
MFLQIRSFSAVIRVLVLVMPLALLAGGPERVRAADFDKLDSAIKEIPADASFYCSWMRNREQVQAVLASKAWAKLMSLPALAQAKEATEKQAKAAGGPLEKFEEWAKDPENRELGDLLLDMLSNEIFIYGGGNVAEVGDTFARAMTAVQMEGFREGLREELEGKKAGAMDTQIDEEKIARAILPELAKKPESIAAPEIILGFKVTKPEVAVTQLKRLEKVVPMITDQFPDLKDRVKWTKVGEDDFLTLTIDSKLMKFDEQMIRKYETKAGEYDALVKRIKDFQITISLGVRGKYVLLAVGETTAPVAKLGKGKRLIDAAELKPLAKFADQRVTGISYASKAFRSQTDWSFFNVQKWIAAAKDALPESSLKPDTQARVLKDLAALSKELKEGEPKAGASLSFSFLSARGREAYAYDWSEHPGRDGSKPLSILDHVGGDPLIVSAGRSKQDPEAWPRLVRWAKVAYGYFEDFGVPAMKPEERKNFEDAMKITLPLLKRFDEVTGKMFLPSLADGQCAFVVDAKLSSKQWHSSMPPSATPIVAPELALVIGVSDAALLQKAMGEYRTILNEWIKAAQATLPKTPLTEIPAPETRNIKGGTMFYYPLPEAWGLDKQVLPNAALAEKVAVLALSQEHSERLLTPTPLKVNGGPLADLKRPLAGATYINCAGLVDLLAGWAEAAAPLAPAKDQEKVTDVLAQVRTVLEVLKVFRSYSSATYFEGDALVTHSEMVITDLK